MPFFVIMSGKTVVRIRMILSSLLLLLCVWSMAGEVNLVSRSADSVLLRHGAGWLNDHPVRAPVGNDSSTAFIAPMPEYDNSPAAQYHASYLGTTNELTMLQQGVDPVSVLLDMPLRTTNTQITSNASLSVFAILCDERNSSDSAATSAMLHIRTSSPTAEPLSLFLGNSPDILAVNCNVSMDATGSRILTYGQNIATKLHILAGNVISSSLDITTKIPYNGERIVLSGDGDSIFFAADLDGFGLLDGQNGIFSYCLSDDTLSFVCAAGANNLDPELAVSADSKVVVFRRRIGALAVAELQNGFWICPDDYPIQAASCRHTAINADGRFITCEMSLSTGDIIQVYRYDRWQKRSKLVSANASDQSADADCQRPDISPDGRQVTFVAAAGNLVSDATDGQHHVYRRELENATIAEDWMLLNLQQGWNLLAIPFIPDPESMARLRDFSFGVLWTWDAGRRRFALLSEVEAPGQGFWLYAQNDSSISISGTSTNGNIPTATQGWHLLGPAEVSAIPSLPAEFLNGQSASVFGLDSANGAFVQIAESGIEYGKSYWIFVKQ